MKRFLLIVEDEFINREILGNMLEDEYHVLYAVNGREGLEVIRENSTMLSAILLDIVMPEMDGFEVIKVLQEDEELKRIPIIVLTAEGDAEVKSLQMGANDFIKKPYDNAEVIRARVNRVIELAEDRKFIQSTEKDELTGLYSKAFFYEYAAMMDRYHHDLKTDAVILNVGHFHLVNEIYGRQMGDRILCIIADAIREFLTDCEGLACRNEADNFLIYVAHHDSYDELLSKINREVERIAKTLHLRIRLGIYSRVEHDIDMEQRFSCARFASNTIRGNYTRYVAYYDITLREQSIFTERIVNDIHEALEKHQFEVYFQPKYNIKGDVPRLSSAEALVRWNHPEYGAIKPGAFLPVFEENGLINILDKYVWEQTIKEIGIIRTRDNITLPISINISRVDLYDPELGEYLIGLLEKQGLTTEDLYLEITESAYTDDTNQLIEAVESLRRDGFTIEMDDFGSGYSSLNSITSMPVDVLKLDMQFIRKMHEDEKTMRLVKLIMDLADFMGVPVVAEGVEVSKQYDILKSMGCDVIQGFYFSKPLPPKEFEELVLSELGETE